MKLPWTFKLFLVVLVVAIASIGTSACTPSADHRTITLKGSISELQKASHASFGECQHTETALHCVQVVSVYDGDTVFIEIPNIPPVFGKRIGVRVLGIDTPEMASKDPCERKYAVSAKQTLSDLIKRAQRVDVINVQRDKYFRVLGDLLIDGKRAADALLERKLAFPYHGEKKPKRDWCSLSPRK